MPCRSNNTSKQSYGWRPPAPPSRFPARAASAAPPCVFFCPRKRRPQQAAPAPLRPVSSFPSIPSAFYFPRGASALRGGAERAAGCFFREAVRPPPTSLCAGETAPPAPGAAFPFHPFRFYFPRERRTAAPLFSPHGPALPRPPVFPLGLPPPRSPCGFFHALRRLLYARAKPPPGPRAGRPVGKSTLAALARIVYNIKGYAHHLSKGDMIC